MAKLHFKYGAMNSGKSDTLIKTAFNYTERGLNIATVKPGLDTKGGGFIVARGGAKRAVDILANPETATTIETDVREAIGLFMARESLQSLACILVDEAQFLSKQQVDQLYETAKIDKISVIAYGLRSDFRTQLFPGSQRLFELADNIEKLPTMCRCGSQAEFNCRKQSDVYVFEGEQVEIDGVDFSYDSLCGTCYADEKGASLA